LKKNKTTVKAKALDIFYRVLSNCSTRCLFRIAKIFAYIAYYTKNQLSTLSRQNIKLCFPELTASQRQQIVFGSLHHTSCAFFELAALWNHPLEDVLNSVKTEDVDQKFYSSEKSKIIIAPHHGSWEMLNLWLADKKATFSLYKPAKSAGVDDYVLQKRSRNKAILVPANTSGLRRLLQGLKNTKSICMILPDQRPAKQTANINAPFYNINAPTSLLIKRLASKLQCDIFIASVTRNLNSADYHLTIKPLQVDKFNQDDFESASYLNNSIQNLIQSDISQYQWAYRRFDKSVYENNIA